MNSVSESGEPQFGASSPLQWPSFHSLEEFCSSPRSFFLLGMNTMSLVLLESLRLKFNVFFQHILSHTGFKLPAVEIKYVVAASIALKGLGSLLFVCGSSFGAFLLFMHQAIFTPLLYDFYNYNSDKKQFSQLFSKFTLNMQLEGALHFFIGMNNKIIMRQTRKKTTKTKIM